MDITYRPSFGSGCSGCGTAPSGELTQTLIAPESLIPAAEILHDRLLIPAAEGIYAWWFDTELPGVPIEATAVRGAYRLLYVGIAPRKPSSAGRTSKSTLRSRITRNHLGTRIGSSTLRRSLAHLLKAELGLSIERVAKKDVMVRTQENILTEWMSAHAALSYLPHTEAWRMENELICRTDLALPLNIKGSNRPFAVEMARIRAARTGHRSSTD